MDKGLGELGFWLAVGIVVAAMIVSGAIKERGREGEKQATARQVMEKRQATRDALLEKAGDNITEVLAYLREKDAQAAAHADLSWRRHKASERQSLVVAAAFLVGMFSFMGGIIALATQHHPVVARWVVSPETGRPVLQPPPPPPTGLEAFLPVGMMLGIWAAGLIIAGLIWFFGTQKNDAQPDA